MASPKPDVAFVGLGAMGFGMATYLVKSGYTVTGSDVWAPSVERFVAAGGKSASSPREASSNAQYLVSMVATAAQTTAALFDPSTGAIHTLPQNATVILCSTVSPTYVPEVRNLLDNEFNRPDVQLLDCPVSGGTVRAADGTLTILASGPDSTLSQSKELLNTMAANLYIIPGGLGSGTKVKMVNQTLAGIHIAAANEAMGFAAALGLNTKTIYDLVNESDGDSWMWGNRMAHAIEGDLKPYSALNIIMKDMVISSPPDLVRTN
jgi:3-hydroxyisobutyrate dehydrogenase